MVQQKIDGHLFAQMVIAGAQNLTHHVKKVDALNVFPVPDGDTGTNMNLSLNSGVNEMKRKLSGSITGVSEALSKGLLMGARGNSGVILSQLFRGFYKSLTGQEEVNARQFADGLQNGVQMAYQAVMKPVEGTILTVAKESARHGVTVSRQTDQIVVVMEEVVRQANETLKKTPDLLPILKQVGVVDSGGQGLVYIYEGMLSVLKGEDSIDLGAEADVPSIDLSASMHDISRSAQSHMSTEDIEYGYCTEFIIQMNEAGQKAFNETSFRHQLSNHGDSLLVVNVDELVKVHIHAEYPGEVMNEAMKYGDLTKIKIENMREQHSHILMEEEYEAAYGTGSSLHKQAVKDEMDHSTSTNERKPYGIVAVSMGEGIAEIFRSLGVETVISGGQTMNPSTEDIVNAIKELNVEQAIILPNNSNIIMAAEQSQHLVDFPVVVIPTKTIAQGMAAMLSFNPSFDLEKNKVGMTEAFQDVKTGQVTFAVRDTSFEGVEIKEGDFLGIADGKIVTANPDINDTTKALLDSMIEDEEILTIFYGQDAHEDQLNDLQDYIAKKYPKLEVDVHDGGQPLYPYIFSLE